MSEMIKHRLFWPLLIITILTFNIFVNKMMIEKQVQVELQKMKSPYGPSPQGAALDHDRLETIDHTLWEQ